MRFTYISLFGYQATFNKDKQKGNNIFEKKISTGTKRINMKGRIVVFSILGCPSCIRAKGYLDQLGLQYIDVNLDKNSEARQKVIELTGKKTVPQVFFNDKHIGGWDNLSNLVSISFLAFSLGKLYVT